MLELVGFTGHRLDGSLGTIQWPRFLDLEENRLDEEAIIGIYKGEWPLLEDLNLRVSEFGVDRVIVFA